MWFRSNGRVVESQQILRWRWCALLGLSLCAFVCNAFFNYPIAIRSSYPSTTCRLSLWPGSDLKPASLEGNWAARNPRGIKPLENSLATSSLGPSEVSPLLSVISCGGNRIGFLTGSSLLVWFDLISFIHVFIHSCCFQSPRLFSVLPPQVVQESEMFFWHHFSSEIYWNIFA